MKPYYETENGKLFYGDCLEIMPQLTPSFDMSLSDLPFGTTKCKWDSVINLDHMWCDLKRLIKPNGPILLFAQSPFDKVLGCSNLEMLRYEWIWSKRSATGFLNAKKMPLKAHENILVFYNKLPNYYPIKTYGHKRKTATRRGVSSEHYGKQIETVGYDSTERYPKSVLNFSSDRQKIGSFHPTQKPVALYDYFIETYTKEGAKIIDITSGGGTLASSCEKLNRKWVMIEKKRGIL